MQEFGIAETSTVDILLNVVLLSGAILGVWLIARCTRRGMSISTYAICALCLLLLAILPDTAMHFHIAAFVVFTIAISALGDMTSVYPAEVFPTEVRSTGIGLATGISRLASAAGTFLLPILLADAGLNATMGALSALCAVAAVMCVILGPETKDLLLAEASAGETS